VRWRGQAFDSASATRQAIARAEAEDDD